MIFAILSVLSVIAMGLLFVPTVAEAHCDTFEGPVIKDALRALEEGSVNPVLKWIRAEDEEEVKKSFNLSMKVRGQSPDSQEIADKSFFETLVRIHRAGEGASFEGIKPGNCIPEAVTKADWALETGEIAELAEKISADVKASVKERFQNAMEKKKEAEKTPEKGREYVEAYISFVHYIEGVNSLTSKEVHHHE